MGNPFGTPSYFYPKPNQSLTIILTTNTNPNPIILNLIVIRNTNPKHNPNIMVGYFKSKAVKVGMEQKDKEIVQRHIGHTAPQTHPTPTSCKLLRI